MTPQSRFEIEKEIKKINELEVASHATDLPETLTRKLTLKDETVAHTDSGVDVVVVVDVDIDVDIVFVDIDIDIDIDVDIDTHTDKD